MKKRTTRCLALLLAVVMILSAMPVAMAEGTSQTATWTKTTLSDIKEADTIAITMTKGNDTWVLPNNNGTKVDIAVIAQAGHAVGGIRLEVLGAERHAACRFGNEETAAGIRLDSVTYTHTDDRIIIQCA